LRKLAGQTAIYGMGTIVPRLLNYFLLTPFYTRVFLTDEYGIITELYAYMAFLLVVLTYGMETTFFRFAEREPDPKKVFSSSLFSLFVTSSAFILIVLLFAQPIANVLEYKANKEYIIYFSMIVALDAFTAIPFAYLRQRNKAMRFSILKVINVTVNVGLNFFFLYFCRRVVANHPDSWLHYIYRPEIGVGYAFISNLAASALTLILLIPDMRGLKPSVDLKMLKRMLSYTFPLLIVGAAGMINEVFDKIIFKFLLHVPEGVVEVEKYVKGQLGIYGAAYKLSVLMTLFIQMFRYAAEPFFFAQAKESNAKQVYADVMKYFVIFGLIIFLGVTLFIGTVKYFIGPRFWEGLYIVPIVLLANLFLGITYNLSIWYKLNDMTRYGAYIAITGAVITIVLNIVLVPQFSYLGAAWAHFSAYVVMIILSYILGQKFYRVKYQMGRIGFYFSLALILFFMSFFIKINSMGLSAAFSIILMLVFLSAVFLIEKGKMGRKLRASV
jgi:O-antigen/teichoic acid export membrane protein